MEASAEKGSSCHDGHKPPTYDMKRSNTELRKALKARDPAWEVLEAQSPDYLECYPCKSHHPLSDIQKFALSSNQSFDLTPRMKLDQKYRTAKFIHPDFHFTVFRMIMKQYRLKGYSEELLKLLSYESDILIDGSQVKQIFAKANIVAGHLLMRVQTAYVVPPTRDSRLYLANQDHLECPHSHRYSWHNRYIARKIVKMFEALETLPNGRQGILWSAQCNICTTRFQVGLQRFEGEGTILLTTKWQNLGPGLSPLDSDIRCNVGTAPYVPFGGLGQSRIPDSLQFVGQPLSPTSVLTSKEREELFRRSGSTNLQKIRAKEALCWKWWGLQRIWPHKF